MHLPYHSRGVFACFFVQPSRFLLLRYPTTVNATGVCLEDDRTIMANNNDTGARTAESSAFAIDNDVEALATDLNAGREGRKDNTAREAPFQSGGKSKGWFMHKESKENRHERFEKKHERREAELERIADGAASDSSLCTAWSFKSC